MRVLMATMQLDIGGAETHIVELSKELARRGIEVFVASNGGAYVGELEEAGITHFDVALHNKKLGSMLSAYKRLERIILDYKIDVVHAHARIPGFLCGLLQKKYGFRFVTTAHWVFNTRFPFNLLSNWGDRSLAVSDDIKNYLIENYGSDPDDIRVTINGVDMEKFSEDTDFSDVAKEFKFGKDKTRIVYVSRMDTDRSFAAHKLIEATPELLKEFPNLEVVIVGGGNDLDKICEEADATNKSLGQRVIITTGGRTDINKFAASADVFVGVSRAALEAMAAKKPAIIAGNEGYIGIFDEDKLQVSIDTNFCCRGCEMTTTEALCSDIKKILDPKNQAYKNHLGEYSQETVKNYYSVKTMADDALKMYISIIKGSKINEVDPAEFQDIEKYLPHGNSNRSIDVLISGYYGFHNSGDDSILSSIINGLKANCPTIKIVVLSKNPAETSNLYGVESIDRFSFGKIFKALLKTKLLISGGGSLIQDVTSSKSLYYYLSIMHLAKLCGSKVMVYANGIGPITKKRNLRLVKNAVNKADMVTLRDKASRTELEKILGSDFTSFVTADPVFALENAEESLAKAALKKSGIKGDNEFFAVAVREWKQNDKHFEEKIAEFCRRTSEKHGLKALIIPMQKGIDKKISEKIVSLCGETCCLLEEDLSPQIILTITSQAKFVVGMRLHTLIYAVKNNVPLIALDYDPKVSAVMEPLDMLFSQKVESIDIKELCSFADEILKNRDALSKKIKEKSQQYSILADKNIEMTMELL
ncbi:MAG: polysaccharide pyruvyl transferase CsaB [Clostridia bacterium]|nr:polysaccharide pyruvyl transferase CsaB [Clostridia bacterium]